MKIYKLLLIVLQTQFIVSDTSSQTPSNLYQMPGYDIPMEFSDNNHRDQIERDILEFDSLGTYTPKKYAELDHNSDKLHLQITQNIVNRAIDNKHKDFFELTDEVKNSEPFKKGTVIDYNRFFNNKTGKYERMFKSDQIKNAMENLHINDFNKNMENSKKQSTFIQNEAKDYLKRPSYLQNDAKTQFLEVSESAKVAFLRYDWQYLYSYNCWASSRWEFAFLFICWNWVWSTIYIAWIFPFSYLRPYANICIWIWFLSYPCSSSIGGRGITWFWMSEKLSEEGKMKEITFRQEFDVVRRLKFHNLLFMSVPDQVKIEISQDHQTWEDATAYEKTPDRSTWWWWWWSYQYYYAPQTYAKSVKIMMKGLRKNWYGNRHGLWWVDFWTQTQTVQIMDKNPPADPRCVARAEVGYYETEKPFILMNCLDAILQNDSREAFFLDNLFIKQWADEMCLTTGNKSKDVKYFTSQKCKDDDNHKFIIDKLGKLIQKSNPTSCIGAKEDNAITQVQTYGYVKVSASLSDSRVNPYNTIDPNSSGFWAAPLELKTAKWEIMFDRQYFVEEITVQFKFKPKKVSVNVLTPDGNWFTVIQEEPSSGDMIVQMTPSQILGVNVHFLELDDENPSEFGRPAYGIKKVLIKRPGVPLSVQTCSYQGKDSKLINRFNIEQIDYIDTSYLVPYRGAKQYLYVVYVSTKTIVEKFLLEVEKYMVVIKIAEEISKSITKINGLIDQIYNELGPYKKYVKMEGEEGKSAGKCYACSQETAALNCVYIKKNNPDRQNGYFWVKTKCMPGPARVYCDFTEGDGNFYQYIGNLAEKPTGVDFKTVQDLREMCDKYGLYPVELQSKAQTLNVIDYINSIDANSEDDIGIPFAIQYDFRILGDKYQSLNSPKSKESTTFLKELMEPQTMIDKLTTIGADLLILQKSQDKLYKGYMSKAKLRGLVCSENKGIKDFKASTAGITCDQTLAMMGSPKSNTILKLSCPSDCAKQKSIKVVGTGPYSEFSSLCKAAVHSGAINDIEGGLIEVKVIDGLEDYKGGTTNEVEASEGKGSKTQKAFQVVKKAPEAACPNLKTKKSFISFHEIIKKVRNNKKSTLNLVRHNQKSILKESHFNVKKVNKKSSFIQSKEKMVSFNDIIQKVNNKKKTSFIESNEKSNNQLELQDAPDDPNAGAGDLAMDMPKAMGYVNKQLSKKLIIIFKYAEFIKDTEQLFKQYELVLSSVFGSSLNPDTQNQLLSTTQLRISATKQMIQELVGKGQAKLATLMEIYLKRLDDLFFLRRYEPHHEQYELDWQSTYLAMDSSITKDGPSQWKITHEDIYPHKAAIAQMKPISCGKDFLNPEGECTATMQQIKYKKFYDFKLQLDFKVRKMGFFGIIFRQKDQYNYYSIEFKDDNVQFRRMMEGEQHIIASGKIDKILSDTWYNIQLIVVETVFKVQIGKEKDANSPAKYDQLKDVLKGEDQYFKNGYQSLFSDSTLGFFVDNYKIEAIDCWKDSFDIDKAIKFKQPESSRFMETYKADINQVWSQDPRENYLWSYIQNGKGRKKAIFKELQEKQTSKAPMILINKQLNKGWLGVDMNLQSKTTEFSIVLFYTNDKNYYEIVFQFNKVIFREVLDGKKSVLKIQERKDIKRKTWYTVYIQITNEFIETWFEEALPVYNDRIREQLFTKEIERPQTKGNFIGLSVNGGSVMVDEFKSYPGKVPEPGEKEDDDDDDDDEDADGDNGDNQKQETESNKKSCEETGTCKQQEIDYSICINTTPTQQNNFCQKETGGLLGPLQNCKEDFCNICCDQQVPPNKKNIKEECVVECMPKKVESDKAYTQCFNSKDPKKSVQAMCAMQFPAKKEKPQANQCKTDFCDLCCILHPLILQKGMTQDDMDDCYEQCHQKFDK